ncbi:glutamate-rich protein 2 isoform X1 [Manis pentadactyla]|uniref:glutamate-rich protein 2 isoform X1 n=1 Tax=Manis pentadactyla TaxID=143292 RepID=UPI00255CDF7B|nr:glutamate-rich protein 2 isoform X1 [Manis pentadactyla]XP_057359905.1 glutamate-rich protein 2 isoform X1 [Manis pentadactyla]
MSEKEVPSEHLENKVSLKSTENRVSSKSVENKDTETNLQSKLWSSSFLKENSGKVGKDAIIVEKEENNEYCLQDIDKLSNTTTDDGEEDSSDEDSDDDSDPHKETPAPLELMAEFLRAEMGQDYHLAKKLCEMILIYEPENPEAKEFFSLIEEMLLMEKAQNLEEDDEDSDEDRGGESEGESSKDLIPGNHCSAFCLHEFTLGTTSKTRMKRNKSYKYLGEELSKQKSSSCKSLKWQHAENVQETARRGGSWGKVRSSSHNCPPFTPSLASLNIPSEEFLP